MNFKIQFKVAISRLKFQDSTLKKPSFVFTPTYTCGTDRPAIDNDVFCVTDDAGVDDCDVVAAGCDGDDENYDVVDPGYHPCRKV